LPLFAVAAVIFWAAAPVNAGNIIKVGKDINIGDEPKVDSAIADSIQANKAKSFFRGAPSTLMIAIFFMLLIFSFVSIPLIPLDYSAILLAFMFGFIDAGALLGKFFLTKTFPCHRQSMVCETLSGLLLCWFIGRVPFSIGMFIKAVVITTGFGRCLAGSFL